MRYRFELDNLNLQKLAQEKIFFQQRANSFLPNHRKKVIFDQNVRSGIYTKILSGSHLWQMGGYSYSWSSLPMDTIVGNYCSIAAQVVRRGLEHPYERFTTSAITYERNYPENCLMTKCRIPPRNNQIIIEDDVWVGAYAMLASGIRIHTGSIIAARANVTKDVPPYAIVGGNPARVIKMRFSEQVIEKLLESRWFDYDVTQLNIPSDIDIYEFIDVIEESKEKIDKLNNKLLVDILTDLSIPFIEAYK